MNKKKLSLQLFFFFAYQEHSNISDNRSLKFCYFEHVKKELEELPQDNVEASFKYPPIQLILIHIDTFLSVLILLHTYIKIYYQFWNNIVDKKRIISFEKLYQNNI